MKNWKRWRWFTKKPTASHRSLSLEGICFALPVLALLSGCQYSSNREAGTALGTGIGAVTGAMIGQQSGHAFGGALIGALAGGVTGNLIGNNEDLRDERDAAIAKAHYLESTRPLLTNSDVIRMVQSGLSDEVIIGAVKNSSGRYDLSPDATVQLKQCGTSDRVIIAMQKAPTYQPNTKVSYVSTRPSTNVGLVVSPVPVMVYERPYYGDRYCRRHW